jgi:hypothetical protein
LQQEAMLNSAPRNSVPSNNVPRSNDSTEPEVDTGINVLPALLLIMLVGFLKLVSE